MIRVSLAAAAILGYTHALRLQTEADEMMGAEETQDAEGAAVENYPDVKYLGCYEDVKASRDFAERIIGSKSYGRMAWDECYTKVKAAGHRYFGMQWGGGCWTGDSFG